ncbi:MAG: radical SAM protein [Pseudomonadota bacterium]
MKILLIQPPIQDFYRTRFREYPLGLLYLASELEKKSHQVSILDARRIKKPKKIDFPIQLAYLKKYFNANSLLFRHYYHFGLTYEEIAKIAQEYKPDIVGLTSNFTPYYLEVINTARAIKKAAPYAKIIVGGHHATADPDSLAAEEAIDCVILGEAEFALPQAIEQTTLPKIYAGAKDLEVHALDKISKPARHLLNPAHYLYHKHFYSMLLTSRGCPHACKFCSAQSLSGHKYRVHSVDYVLNEVEELIAKFKIGVIDIQDDNFLFNQDRAKELLAKLIAKTRKNNIELLASNGLNVAHLDKELLNLMKQVGFKKIDVALPTASASHQSILGRPETLTQYESMLDCASSAGIEVNTNIIIGIPFQPLAEMKATVEYLQSKPTLISPSIFYNVPGMPIYEEMKKYEYTNHHLARRSSAFNNWGQDFVREDIIKLFAKIREMNLKLI